MSSLMALLGTGLVWLVFLVIGGGVGFSAFALYERLTTGRRSTTAAAAPKAQRERKERPQRDPSATAATAEHPSDAPGGLLGRLRTWFSSDEHSLEAQIAPADMPVHPLGASATTADEADEAPPHEGHEPVVHDRSGDDGAPAAFAPAAEPSRSTRLTTRHLLTPGWLAAAGPEAAQQPHEPSDGEIPAWDPAQGPQDAFASWSEHARDMADPPAWSDLTNQDTAPAPPHRPVSRPPADRTSGIDHFGSEPGQDPASWQNALRAARNGVHAKAPDEHAPHAAPSSAPAPEPAAEQPRRHVVEVPWNATGPSAERGRRVEPVVPDYEDPEETPIDEHGRRVIRVSQDGNEASAGIVERQVVSKPEQGPAAAQDDWEEQALQESTAYASRSIAEGHARAPAPAPATSDRHPNDAAISDTAEPAAPALQEDRPAVGLGSGALPDRGREEPRGAEHASPSRNGHGHANAPSAAQAVNGHGHANAPSAAQAVNGHGHANAPSAAQAVNGHGHANAPPASPSLNGHGHDGGAPQRELPAPSAPVGSAPPAPSADVSQSGDGAANEEPQDLRAEAPVKHITQDATADLPPVPAGRRQRPEGCTLTRTEAIEELNAIYGLTYDEGVALVEAGLWGFENHDEWVRGVRAGRGVPPWLPQSVVEKVLTQPLRDLEPRIEDLRKKRDAVLALQELWGVGPVEANALYEAGYKDREALQSASTQKIGAVSGIGAALAFQIKASLHGLAPDDDDADGDA